MSFLTQNTDTWWKDTLKIQDCWKSYFPCIWSSHLSIGWIFAPSRQYIAFMNPRFHAALRKQSKSHAFRNWLFFSHLYSKCEQNGGQNEAETVSISRGFVLQFATTDPDSTLSELSRQNFLFQYPSLALCAIMSRNHGSEIDKSTKLDFLLSYLMRLLRSLWAY